MPYHRFIVISSLLSLNGGQLAYCVPGSGLLSHRYQGASKSRFNMASDEALPSSISRSASRVSMFAIGRTSKDKPGSIATGRSEYAISSAATADDTSMSEDSSGIAATKHSWHGDSRGR